MAGLSDAAPRIGRRRVLDGALTPAELPGHVCSLIGWSQMPRHGTDRSTTQTAIAGVVDPPFLEYRSAAAPDCVDIRVLELLSARLCHELSGPIAAINNGVELLSEEDPAYGSPVGAEFIRDAVTLVGSSARRAGSRLQFYRFAYGLSQTGASSGPTPHELVRSLFEAGRIVCDYAESVRVLSARWQKLACNLLSVGADSLPHGGRLALTARPLMLEAAGEAAALSSEAHAALTLAAPVAELTARTVQAYFAGLLAKSLDCVVIAKTEAGLVRLTVIAAPD